MPTGSECAACRKPLGGMSSALMARDGRLYHIACWCRAVDDSARLRPESEDRRPSSPRD